MFRTRTRDEWCALLEGTDVCFAPVLRLGRGAASTRTTWRASTFVEVDGVVQPAPAPRFSRTVPGVPTPPVPPGANGEEILRDWGLSDEAVDGLRRTGALPGPR